MRLRQHQYQLHTKMGLDPFIALYVALNANTNVSVNNFNSDYSDHTFHEIDLFNLVRVMAVD